VFASKYMGGMIVICLLNGCTKGLEAFSAFKHVLLIIVLIQGGLFSKNAITTWAFMYMDHGLMYSVWARKIKLINYN